MVKIGTNFYLHTTNKKYAQKYAPYSYRLTDNPKLGYEIHIAKTSCGWLPLFEAHRNGIQSVKEYKKAYDTGKFKIYDEYGDQYTWEEFDERVLQFNGGKLGVKEPEKIESNPNDPYYDENTPEYIPISHVPGSKQSYKGFGYYDIKYFTDDEGYEFTEGEFS